MSEYEEYINERILKAKLEPRQAEPVAKAEQENPVLTMFERFNKGDLDFSGPTKEEQLAANKASSESEAEPLKTVEGLFVKAKKGEL